MEMRVQRDYWKKQTEGWKEMAAQLNNVRTEFLKLQEDYLALEKELETERLKGKNSTGYLLIEETEYEKLIEGVSEEVFLTDKGKALVEQWKEENRELSGKENSQS